MTMSMIRLTDLNDNAVLVDYESIERVWLHTNGDHTLIQPKGKELLRDTFKVKETPEEVYEAIKVLLDYNARIMLADQRYEDWARDLIFADPGNQGS